MRSLSVIIPSNGKINRLKKTLRGILKMNKTEKLEIIVISDSNHIEVKSFLHKVKKRFYCPVTVIDGSDLIGPGCARNKGIKAAVNEWLIFADDDLNLPSNWFENIQYYINNINFIATNIQVRKKHSETLGEKFSRINKFNAKEKFDKEGFGLTTFLIVKKELFSKVGFFLENFYSVEDLEFSQRVGQYGFEKDFIEELVIKHEPKKWSQQFRQIRRILLGHQQLARLYPSQYRYLNKSFIDLIRLLKYMSRDLIFFKKTKLYQSGEVTFFQHEVAQFIYYSLHLAAQVLVLTFPKKAFDW